MVLNKEPGTVMKKTLDSYATSRADSISPLSLLQQSSDVKTEFNYFQQKLFFFYEKVKMTFHNTPLGPYITFSAPRNHMMIWWNREHKELE